MKVKSMRSLVFYQVNDMVKNSTLDLSQALKIAWQIYRMKKHNEKVFFFRYKKLDGSLRYAKGRFFSDVSDSDVKAQHYLDFEKHEYRAFKPALFLGVDSEIELSQLK